MWVLNHFKKNFRSFFVVGGILVILKMIQNPHIVYNTSPHTPPGLLLSLCTGVTGKLGLPWLLFAARFLLGVGRSNSVTIRAYLCRITNKRNRTAAIAFVSAFDVRDL
jgi:MFS family permease